MALRPKNWDKFQHYKQRCPPWIKMYRTLLDDREFMCLPVASKALAMMLWLLASEHTEGVIEGVPADWAFRLRMTDNELLTALKPLIDNGMFEDASNVLAECLQDACSERENRDKGRGQRQKKNGAVAPVVQSEVPLSVPSLDHDVWQRWVAYRKEIGKPLRSISLTAAAVDLAKHGANQAAVVEQSIAQGWQGLFPLKQTGKPTKDPRFSIARNFANVDYWEGAKPDDAI
jgi:hypothetical protein